VIQRNFLLLTNKKEINTMSFLSVISRNLLLSIDSRKKTSQIIEWNEKLQAIVCSADFSVRAVHTLQLSVTES